VEKELPIERGITVHRLLIVYEVLRRNIVMSTLPSRKHPRPKLDSGPSPLTVFDSRSPEIGPRHKILCC